MDNVEKMISTFEQHGACPITFVGDNAIANPDLNNMFVSGYQFKKKADEIRSAEFADLLQGRKFSDEETVRMIYRMSNKDQASKGTIIDNFLISNVTDLTMNTLYRALPECFILTDDISAASFCNIDAAAVREYVTNSVIMHYMPDDVNLAEVFFGYNQVMDGIYANIVTNIFDRIIVDNINRIFTENIQKEFYRACYAECYGVTMDDVKCIPNDGFIYTFCSGIVREKFSKYLVPFREALMSLATSLTYMSEDIRNKAIDTTHQELLEYERADRNGKELPSDIPSITLNPNPLMDQARIDLDNMMLPDQQNDSDETAYTDINDIKDEDLKQIISNIGLTAKDITPEKPLRVKRVRRKDK